MNLQEFRQCFDQIDTFSQVKFNAILHTFNDVIILGNGGSNAVSCHIAQDYTKKLNKRALAFGDTSRMSCYANDYGWDNAYAKFVEEFSYPNTLVILISSSGKSQNIINAAAYCREKQLPYVILTGFDGNNPLRAGFSDKALVEFYVNSHDYGIVECLHEVILHSVI